jgi:hypothetical protein
MKSYQSGDDLRELGINLLTGEACGLAMRILCDLNEDGIKLWETFTRSKADTEGWNDGKASVMIPNSMFRDLWIFGQVMKGTRYVFIGGYVFGKDWTETHYDLENWVDNPRSGGSYDDGKGITYRHPVDTWKPSAMATNDDESWAHVQKAIEEGYFYINRVYAKSSHPGTGLDNQHAMSGRIA